MWALQIDLCCWPLEAEQEVVSVRLDSFFLTPSLLQLTLTYQVGRCPSPVNLLSLHSRPLILHILHWPSISVDYVKKMNVLVFSKRICHHTPLIFVFRACWEQLWLTDEYILIMLVFSEGTSYINTAIFMISKQVKGKGWACFLLETRTNDVSSKMCQQKKYKTQTVWLYNPTNSPIC